ncbi:glycosyltransferase family 2 protein [Lachnospiraceae bacterium MD1]|uniref:Glycosyltransferase family 2 protein n=1 Tax=Variimorphobacter saccharofermentans TaxID=2755051 RepID=A0A839JZN6_9FIRM|nr:glycosyltransferase family 2 protein [Variimorphobacter saccharofermentans]MBB2182846.1 glycosyltransferase family 2 protein [Variimorphobacter saccharofermentans]
MPGKKKVSIVIPSYNEEDNIRPITEAVKNEIENNLSEYDYEIIIIDNNSQDNTRAIIRSLCAEDKKVRAILNEKNFGPDNSPYYGLMQASGDCAILFCADFQDPLEMIHKMVREWENGYTVVTAVKTESQENKLVRFFRTIYYRLIKRISSIDIIEHFTGFGCYDKKFLDIMRSLDDPVPFLRGVVAEFAGNRKTIEYEQQKRRAGKSHIGFFTLYDMAMRSFTSYTKVGLRMCTFFGFGTAAVSLIIALVYLIIKLIMWDEFEFGIPVILVGMFFIGAVQLIFLGFIGEYILTMNQRSMKRPLVIEHERINFDVDDNND